MVAVFSFDSRHNTYSVKIMPNNQLEEFASVSYRVRNNQVDSVFCRNLSFTPSYFQFIISRFGTLSFLYLKRITSSEAPYFYFDFDFEFR